MEGLAQPLPAYTALLEQTLPSSVRSADAVASPLKLRILGRRQRLTDRSQDARTQ
jgi:hypothetical protein